MENKSQAARSMQDQNEQMKLYKRIFSQMQTGIMYPADYACFAPCNITPEPTRTEFGKIIQGVQTWAAKNLGGEPGKSAELVQQSHNHIIGGVAFDVYSKWCEADSKTPPKGIDILYKPEKDESTSEVFERKGSIFKNSQAKFFFHFKSDTKENINKLFDQLKATTGRTFDFPVEPTMGNRRNFPNDSANTGRVLGCRFSEDLNNPADPINIANHMVAGYEDEPNLGGSVVLAQRFTVNWNHLNCLSTNQFEDCIGRKVALPKSIILPGRDPRCHIRASRPRNNDKEAEGKWYEGNSTYIMRMGLPFGQAENVSEDKAIMGGNKSNEKGIYFAGYAKMSHDLERTMDRQIGRNTDYMEDRLLQHMRSEGGGMFYVPPKAGLGLALSEAEQKWVDTPTTEGSWASGPGVQWDRLTRHYTEQSGNPYMFYNHYQYLYEMTTKEVNQKNKDLYDPPTPRVLTLLADMFRIWQDSWYFEKRQAPLGHIRDLIKEEFPEENVEEIMKQSIVVRKGWASRLTCRVYASHKYGFRGTRTVMEANGAKRAKKERHGLDSFRIHPCEILVGALPDLSLAQGTNAVTYLREDEQIKSWLAGVNEYSAAGHLVPSYEKVLEKGIGGMIEEALAMQKAHPDNKDFYRGVELALLGVKESLGRYRDLAKTMLDEFTTASAKDNMTEIHHRLSNLAEGKAPSTFAEGLQLVWSYHTALHQINDVTSLGRMDQYLFPLYEADIKAGRITDVYAQECIDSFWIKMSEKILTNRSAAQDEVKFGHMAMGGRSGGYPQGASLNQWIMQLTIGGCVSDDSADPTPAYNALTTFMLRAAGRLPLTAPCLSLRVGKYTPDEVLREAAKCILSGGAHPVLMNDDKIVPGLAQSGNNIGHGDCKKAPELTPVAEKSGGKFKCEVQLAHARNYSCDGCYEPMLGGRSWFSIKGFSALDPLECALNEGRLYGVAGPAYFSGVVKSIRTPNVSEIDTFDKFVDVYFKHFEMLWIKQLLAEGALDDWPKAGEICPSPLLSTVIEGCMERGKDIYCAGAMYNIFGPCWIAVPSAIDSLYAIKTMCFGPQAVVSLAELRLCLINDWGYNMVEPFFSRFLGNSRIESYAERYQYLRKCALQLPKYGQGSSGKNAEVKELGDMICKRICDMTVDVLTNPCPELAQKLLDLSEAHGTKEHPLSLQITPGTGTFENFVQFGTGSGASACGRRNHAPISSDYSAAPTANDEAPQAPHIKFLDALDSFSGEGVAAMWDGAPTDFNIPEDFPLDDLQKMIRKFADGVGSNMLTITCANPDTMKKAVEQPETYDLLRVRMGGWTEFFCSMYNSSQEQHRRRPVYVTEDAVPTGKGCPFKDSVMAEP